MIAGLTGGIGSGKSTVAKLFHLLGAAVFYSDEAARLAYFNPSIKEQVIGLLGADAYRSERELNKSVISRRIFEDPKVLSAINAVIHPEVGRMFRLFTEEHRGKLIIKESALLFEAKVVSQVDTVIVVAAPDEMRIKRVMARERLTREEVEARFRSQLPQETKVEKADYVIHNDESQLVIPQVESIFNELKP